MYYLAEDEKKKLTQGIQAAISMPLINDVVDYVWEGIFCFTKGVDLVDPLNTLRKKSLYDVVDTKNEIGWSAKTLLWTIKPGVEFELVIQRADIFKKAKDLGFSDLSVNSDPQLLGEALLKHWNSKIENDSKIQNVKHMRICVLLKSRNRKNFAYYENDLKVYSPNDVVWRWTDKSKNGLQGIRKKDNFCVFRWYPNQKQLFERFSLPDDTYIFGLEPKRLNMEVVVEQLVKALNIS